MRNTENTLHAAQALVLGVSVFADLAFLGGAASTIGAALSGIHLLRNAPFASKSLDRFTEKALNRQFKTQTAILRDGDRENIEDMLGKVTLDPTKIHNLPRTGEAFVAEMLKHLTGDYAEARLRSNFALIVAPVIDALLTHADFKAALDEARTHAGHKRDADTHRQVSLGVNMMQRLLEQTAPLSDEKKREAAQQERMNIVLLLDELTQMGFSISELRTFLRYLHDHDLRFSVLIDLHKSLEANE